MDHSRPAQSTREPGERSWIAAALLLLGMAVPAPLAAASSGDETDSATGSVDARAVLEALDEVEEYLDAWSERADAEGPATSAEVVEVLGKGASAEQIFEWVRSHVEFEPYRGAIRSPEQVLAVRSANAVDQARLLAALYDRVGISYRYVFGELRDVAAVGVLSDFAGKLERASARGEEATMLLSRSPAYANDRYLDLVESHAWLEVETGDGAYLAADPVVASGFGATKVRADTRSEHLPEQHRSRLEIQLTATLEGGHEKSLLTVESGFDRIAFEALHFTIEPSSVEGEVVPRIRIAGRSETGERFAPSKLRRLALEYDTSIGAHERHFERELYSDSAEGSGFRARRVVATSLLVPGWASAPEAARVAVEETETLIDDVRDRVRRAANEGRPLEADDVESVLAAASTLGALARTLHADALTEHLASATGVRPVQKAPRLLHAVAAAADGLDLEVESRGGRLEGIPAGGMSEHGVEAFRTLRGYALDELGADLTTNITGRSIPSAREVLERARTSDVPMATVHGTNFDEVDALEASSRAAAALRRDVRAKGRIVLAPKRPIELDGERRFAWWSVDPNGGAVRGRRAPLRVGFLEVENADSGRGVSVGEGLVRAATLVASGLEGRADYEQVACEGLEQARFAGRTLCADRGPQSLPSIGACQSPEASSESSAGGIGVVGIETGQCKPRVREARCGASAAETLLKGKVRLRAPSGGTRSVAPGRGAPGVDGALRCSGPR